MVRGEFSVADVARLLGVTRARVQQMDAALGARRDRAGHRRYRRARLISWAKRSREYPAELVERVRCATPIDREVRGAEIRISIRVTDEEATAWHASATAAGVTLSEYVRTCVATRA